MEASDPRQANAMNQRRVDEACVKHRTKFLEAFCLSATIGVASMMPDRCSLSVCIPRLAAPLDQMKR